jgi:nitroimidazol reductase NimA-like FMN-containing flavoprotein (pyridoxamine 5'-phosphate oxidase superfamily)
MEKAIRRAIGKSSFCTLATASGANRPLAVGVLYAAVGDLLYIATLDTSAKVRNIRENDRVAVCIPVRRYPVGPPFSVQFQGKAEVLPTDDPEIAQLLEAGRLKRITSHGELDDPAACFLRIARGPRVATYGIGVPLRELLRDPIHASRSVRMS